MSMRPSGKSSATIAATFEVPMSRATMRFLFSLAMSDSLARAGLGATALGNAQRKAVGVAQVDIVQTAPGLSECLRVYRHEPRETFVDAVFVRVTSELHAETVGEPELPGKTRAQQNLAGLEGQRDQQTPKGKVAPRDFAFAAGGPGEYRQRGVALPAEKLSMSINEPQLSSLAPAREGHVLFDAYFQAIGPAASQFGAAHPWNPLEQRAHRLQVHGKKSTLDPALERADDLATGDMLELAPHDDGLERKHGGLEQDARACVHDERERKRVERVCGDVGEARVIPHDRLPAPRAAPARESAGTNLRRTIRRGAPPSARASGRSCLERC